MESLTPTVTTPEILNKKLDSLTTKAINLLGAEIECVIDSLIIKLTSWKAKSLMQKQKMTN